MQWDLPKVPDTLQAEVLGGTANLRPAWAATRPCFKNIKTKKQLPVARQGGKYE